MRVFDEYPTSAYGNLSLFKSAICQVRLSAYNTALSRLSIYRDASQDFEELSQALFWIGKVYQIEGNTAAAEAAWKEGANADPTGYYSERARDLLQGRDPFTPPQDYDIGIDDLVEKEEAQIYLYLIENGPSTFLEVSKGTNINRSKIYRNIDELTKKGLLELSHTKWSKKLIPVEPDTLETFVKKKEDEAFNNRRIFDELVSELSYSGKKINEKFIIKTYKNADGLQEMLWNQLDTQEKIVYTFTIANIESFTSKKFANLYRKETSKTTIFHKELANEKRLANTKAYATAPLWETVHEFRHLSRELLDITHNLSLYDDKIAIISWNDNQYFGVEIQNKLLARMFKQVFEVFWGMGGVLE